MIKNVSSIIKNAVVGKIHFVGACTDEVYNEIKNDLLTRRKLLKFIPLIEVDKNGDWSLGLQVSIKKKGK